MASNPTKQTRREPPQAAAPASPPAIIAGENDAAPAQTALVAPAASKEPPPSGFAAAFDAHFDAAEWSKKTVELWSDHATAMVDHVEKIARAKSFDEIASLQSRYLSERFEAVMRQSCEFWTLAQKMIDFSVAPLIGPKTA
ncbi:MAG: phasin family protein [Methylocystis sp.]|nr:phasin family protein [Methylocystis sp.]